MTFHRQILQVPVTAMIYPIACLLMIELNSVKSLLAFAALFVLQLKPPGLDKLTGRVLQCEGKNEHWSLKDRFVLANDVLDGFAAAGEVQHDSYQVAIFLAEGLGLARSPIRGLAFWLEVSRSISSLRDEIVQNQLTASSWHVWRLLVTI